MGKKIDRKPQLLTCIKLYYESMCASTNVYQTKLFTCWACAKTSSPTDLSLTTKPHKKELEKNVDVWRRKETTASSGRCLCRRLAACPSDDGREHVVKVSCWKPGKLTNGAKGLGLYGVPEYLRQINPPSHFPDIIFFFSRRQCKK